MLHCCISGCKYYKNWESEKNVLFNHFLIDQQLKRHWSVKIWRDNGYMQRFSVHESIQPFLANITFWLHLMLFTSKFK